MLRGVIIQTDVVKTQALQVTQANALARASQNMTWREKRLLALALSRVRRSDQYLHTFLFPFDDLWKLLEFEQDHDAYRRVRELTRSLLTRVLEVDNPDGSWKMHQWVSAAEYLPRGHADNPNKISCLKIRLHDDLIPLILRLTEHFGSYALAQVLGFKRFTSGRIFELLYHTSQAFRIKTVVFELADLKKRLGVAGKYPNFADFTKRILKPAQKDCAKFTELNFAYQPKKTGRKVTSIEFTVIHNEEYQLALNLLPETIVIQTIREKIPPGGLEPTDDLEQVAEDLRSTGWLFDPHVTIADYGIDLVRDTVALAKQIDRRAAGTNNPIKNLPGLISKMLDEGSAKGFTAKQQQKLKQTSQKEAVVRIITTVEAGFDQERASVAEETWQELSNAQQKKVQSELRKTLPEAIRVQFNRNGWTGKAYTSFRNGLMERQGLLTYPDNLRTLKAFAAAQLIYQEQPAETQKKILQQFSNT